MLSWSLSVLYSYPHSYRYVPVNRSSSYSAPWITHRVSSATLSHTYNYVIQIQKISSARIQSPLRGDGEHALSDAPCLLSRVRNHDYLTQSRYLLNQKNVGSVHSQKLIHLASEYRPRPSRMIPLPSNVRESVIRCGVQDLVKPCVRVKRQNIDIPMGRGEMRGVIQEGSVIVDDVLFVERRDGRPNVVRGALEGRESDEEIRPAEVVVIRVLL